MEKIKKYTYYVASVLLIVSAACYITEWPVIPYVYAAACAPLALIVATASYDGENLRLRRLAAISSISAALLPISAFFMFKDRSDWIACLLLYALLQLYVIFVTGIEKRREKRNND